MDGCMIRRGRATKERACNKGEGAAKERACNTCGNQNERANVRWRDGKYAHVRTSEGVDSRCVKKR